ncbi:MAG TPA: thioesterase family protein [Caulobacteraceae bacterium]|jgi:4-hydroxybenzoyl-CoA thioesterase
MAPRARGGYEAAMAPSSIRFSTRRKVRFADCDPAGIVFYPRYFEMLNGAVEDWFEDIGFPFAETHVHGRMATPVRAIEAEFLRSSRLGETLDLHIELLEVGRTSASMAGLFTCTGEERFRARFTMVHIDLASHSPQPWPDALRAAMTGSGG